MERGDLGRGVGHHHAASILQGLNRQPRETPARLGRCVEAQQAKGSRRQASASGGWISSSSALRGLQSIEAMAAAALSNCPSPSCLTSGCSGGSGQPSSA